MQIDTRSIAVVDDDDGVRTALARLLRSAGLAVQTYASGAAFLDALESELPACVILDLHMPGLSGFEVQTRLARISPLLPVIIVTGNHSYEALVKVTRLQDVAYLIKPVDSQLLLKTIDTALKSNRALGAPARPTDP